STVRRLPVGIPDALPARAGRPRHTRAPQAPACESRAGSVPGTRAGRGRRDGARLRGPSHREREAGALRRGVSAGRRAGASETGAERRRFDARPGGPWGFVVLAGRPPGPGEATPGSGRLGGPPGDPERRRPTET